MHERPCGWRQPQRQHAATKKKYDHAEECKEADLGIPPQELQPDPVR